MTISPEILDQFKAIVGLKGWAEDAVRMAPYLTEWRDRYIGASPLILFPKSVEEVQEIVRTASEHTVKLVPQGGNTGLVGGGIPFDVESGGGDEVILNLSRLNGVRALDPDNYTITVNAGMTLLATQEAAAEADRLFPLSLGAEGTAQIGGNVSTNAGGVAVLKYGTMRDLVLGVEAVLPDGSLYSDLSGLRKDNTGYRLTDLLIGSEGTLAVITAVTLKLFPAPRDRATAWLAVPSPKAALDLLTVAREHTGDSVVAFELMPYAGLKMVLDHIPGTKDPLTTPSPWFVLLDLASPASDLGLSERLETILEAAMGAELVTDGAIAQSQAQISAFWKLRETMSEAQKGEGGSIQHDVAVPVSRVPEFLDRALQAVENLVPGIQPVPYGHLGDGNIHFNLSQPKGADKAAYMARTDEVSELVHDIVMSFGGSISAEHGIGRKKRDELLRLKDPVALATMHAIKQTIDPKGIMNPGKVL